MNRDLPTLVNDIAIFVWRNARTSYRVMLYHLSFTMPVRQGSHSNDVDGVMRVRLAAYSPEGMNTVGRSRGRAHCRQDGGAADLRASAANRTFPDYYDGVDDRAANRELWPKRQRKLSKDVTRRLGATAPVEGDRLEQTRPGTPSVPLHREALAPICLAMIMLEKFRQTNIATPWSACRTRCRPWWSRQHLSLVRQIRCSPARRPSLGSRASACGLL